MWENFKVDEIEDLVIIYLNITPPDRTWSQLISFYEPFYWSMKGGLQQKLFPRSLELIPSSAVFMTKNQPGIVCYMYVVLLLYYVYYYAM